MLKISSIQQLGDFFTSNGFVRESLKDIEFGVINRFRVQEDDSTNTSGICHAYWENSVLHIYLINLKTGVNAQCVSTITKSAFSAFLDATSPSLLSMPKFSTQGLNQSGIPAGQEQSIPTYEYTPQQEWEWLAQPDQSNTFEQNGLMTPYGTKQASYAYRNGNHHTKAGELLLPVTNTTGEVKTLIKLSKNGEVVIRDESVIAGCYFAVNPVSFRNSEWLFITTDLFSAIALRKIVDANVYFGLNRSNIPLIAQSVRLIKPDINICICGKGHRELSYYIKAMYDKAYQPRTYWLLPVLREDSPDHTWYEFIRNEPEAKIHSQITQQIESFNHSKSSLFADHFKAKKFIELHRK